MEKLSEGVHDAVQDVCAWLDQVKKLDELINAKLAERDQLWALATNITPEMTGMPHGGGVSDKVGNIAVKLADLARETNDLVDHFVDYKASVVATLEKLPPNEYGALHRHYIQYMTWEEVAADMGRCSVQVWRYRKKGLEMLVDVIECYTIPVV